MDTAYGSLEHPFWRAILSALASFGVFSGQLLFAAPISAPAQWRVLSSSDQRQSQPPQNYSGGVSIKLGDPCPDDQKFRWLVAELEIPATIANESTAGSVVGLQLNCGDGGEVYVNNVLQARYDNDHPALAILSEAASPGAKVRVAIQVYAHVQGGDKFDQANWVIIDPKRAKDPLVVTVDAQQPAGKVPDGIVGLSQGGGMSDYDDATAHKLKDGGFRWFRMDNIFTGVVKAGQGTNLVYDWADFDRRVDFITKIGAELIMAVSYMPQVLDAVPNNERQSAPKDYAAWEELCFQAARHSLQRGKRIPFWEVWNEVNTGWLKPGPEDTGSDAFKKLYTVALGKEEKNLEVVRRFEAYCKLYRATARGLRRADPQAKIGGPALASGPFENSDYGHCQHGKGFARGLMLWCQQEKLPLDFVSWHEYFQPPETIVKEAEAFRTYLAGFPELRYAIDSFMITEWNEAWWADRPQDNELGAAWCANSITRAFLPAHIDRPCFFYVKQGDMNFRGDYSLLMKDNLPKASYNVARIFNHLRGKWLPVSGTDDDVSVVAAWDAKQTRLAIVLVNFRDRYALRRPVQLRLNPLPATLNAGRWQECVVDATHSNAWNDLTKAELTVTRSGEISGKAFNWEQTLPPNSVTLIELGKR
jgi:xylan 1,4-beta-xylosidase